MQIVIDIPEEEWTRWIVDGEMNANVLSDSLNNGIPLPKGHSFIAICDSDFQITEEVENILKDTVFVGNDDCDYCFDIAAIIPTESEK